MSLYLALLIGAIICAVLTVRSKPLSAALWLAALSAITAILLYLYGAPEVAVVELSVGAGLITVLLAFAISMAEDEAMPTALVPKPYALLLVSAACILLLWLVLPHIPPVRAAAVADAPFIVQVWENRLLDLVVQIAIVVSGVMGVLSLLGEAHKMPTPSPESSR